MVGGMGARRGIRLLTKVWAAGCGDHAVEQAQAPPKALVGVGMDCTKCFNLAH